MVKRIFSCLLAVILLAGLSACTLGDLSLTARFNRDSGLQVDDRIVYQKNKIGAIDRITDSGDGQSLVKLAIDSESKDQITDLSIFYIDDDPDRPGHKAVFIEQQGTGGIPLVNGSVVTVLDHPPSLLRMLENLSRKAMELGADLAGQTSENLRESQVEIEKGLQQLEKELRAAPESEEAKKLAANIDRMVRELRASLERTRNLISEDLFKAIHDALESFRKRLEELGKQSRPPAGGQEQKEDKVRI